MRQGSGVVFGKEPSQVATKGLVLQLQIFGGPGLERKST